MHALSDFNYDLILWLRQADINKQVQPNRKHKPPIGVIGPSHLKEVMAYRYKEPENNPIPKVKKPMAQASNLGAKWPAPKAQASKAKVW